MLEYDRDFIAYTLIWLRLAKQKQIAILAVTQFRRNDSHAAIGRQMGQEPFRHLCDDRRCNTNSMCLETPQGEEQGQHLARINLQAFRRLVKS